MTLPPSILVWVIATTALAAPVDPVDALLRDGNVAGALTAAQAAVEADPANVAATELYIDLMIATGRGAEVLALTRARAESAPTNADLQYLLGRATNDPQQAEAAYRAALAIAPQHPRALMGLAAVSEAKGDITGALAGFSRAVEVDRTLAEAWVGKARNEVRLGRGEAAAATARSGLAVHPRLTGLLVVLGHLAPAEADPLLKAAIAGSPRDAALHDAYAETRLAAGDARTAVAAAKQALALDPTLASAARTATLAREQIEGRLDGAGRRGLAEAAAVEATDRRGSLPRYDALATKYPRSAVVRLSRASVRRSLGDSAGALQDLADAANADPGNLEAQIAAGTALLRAKRYAEAKVPLGVAAAARPTDLTLGLALIEAQAAGGVNPQALASAEALVIRYPHHPDVVIADAVQLAGVGRAAEAYARVKTALAVTPDPRLAAVFVQVAPAAGHPEEAAAILEQIVQVTGNANLAEAARRLRAMAAEPPG